MHERWWDGCDRVVVDVEPGVRGKKNTVLVLDCGHRQLAAAANTAPNDGAICRECARLKTQEVH